ncbi:YcnI family protein [Alicyclobacillus acidoterrestris]|uniref:YcnI family copper-binding membrane protein n=1 Tax=Alicyclobacillus TaxID=29330 RepID=UPI001190E727|nr:DUF1775 domain-containing protein [Alicyclobacillus suci]GEO26524.1 hypothetical protein AAC03nite_23090 [Alicyclobacillus acidoterrestris]
MNRIVRGLLTLSSGLATFAVTATAFAHVIVSPAQSTVGAWQEYTMRVPCEKTDATTKVVLKLPSDVQFQQYEPVAGWSVKTQKSGQTEIVTWQATSSAGIQPGQFMEFPFIATNPKQPTEIDWDAYQYYQDGTIVEWTGAPNSETPHSITQIVNSSDATQTTSNSEASTSSDASAQSSTPAASAATYGLGWTTADTWVLTVSVVAILISIFAIIMSLRGGSKK